MSIPAPWARRGNTSRGTTSHQPGRAARRTIDAWARALLGDPVAATFIVTSPAHEAVRAQLYLAGVNYSNDRVLTFDWQFTVRTRHRAWHRFAAHCHEDLKHPPRGPRSHSPPPCGESRAAAHPHPR